MSGSDSPDRNVKLCTTKSPSVVDGYFASCAPSIGAIANPNSPTPNTHRDKNRNIPFTSARKNLEQLNVHSVRSHVLGSKVGFELYGQ